MKKTVRKCVYVLLYPLIWCHRVIMDAPIMDFDNALAGYSDWVRCSAPKGKTVSVPVKPKAV